MFYDYFVMLLALGRLAVTVLMGNVAPPPDRIPNLDYSVHEEEHVVGQLFSTRYSLNATLLGPNLHIVAIFFGGVIELVRRV